MLTKVFLLPKAADVIEEVIPSEKALNGPAVVPEAEPSKLQLSPEERPSIIPEGGESNQEEAVLNGVS